jgi:molybdopterin molybdotransferase
MEAGARIRAAEVAMLAAMGRAEVTVIRRARVAVISTGDEIVEISCLPGPGQIRNSNSYALAALVAESGAELHSMAHVRDDEEDTERALRVAAGLNGEEPADVIVTSGGVSVGDKDFVKPVLERLGTLDFWRVKMKPGKPIAVGRIAGSLFFGLPGNPVSTMVTFELFVRPAIGMLSGHSSCFRPRVEVTLQEGFSRSPGREEYVRAKVVASESGFLAVPTGAQGSGVLSSMLGANALLVIAPEAESFAAGDRVPALLFDLPDSGFAEKAS